MAVYVDDMHASPLGEHGGVRMCHMIADSTEELMQMADRIGVDRYWIQGAGTAEEHFDISESRREEAIRHGAVAISAKQLAVLIDKRRPSPRLSPEIHARYG